MSYGDEMWYTKIESSVCTKQLLAEPNSQEKNLNDLHEQNRIDAAVVLRIVRNLSVLRPDHLAVLRDQTELTDVHLDHGAFGHHAQTRVHRTARVLLDADYRQVKGGL